MKKILCIALAVLLTLGMCACAGEGGSAASSNDGLQVGFGRVNITPGYTVQLGGGAAVRESTGYQDISYVTCVAVSQDGETYLVYTMDFICAEDKFVDPAKKSISEATGIPEANILMNATHTHSGVAIRTDNSVNVNQYRSDFYQWAAEAGQAAIADLSAAEAYYGDSETEGLTFVRHYKIADGTYAGANFGSFTNGVTDHAVEADTQVQIVRFVRPAEDKKDVVMMSFPCHATMNQSNTVLSADFPSPCRDYIEANSDTLVAYYIAAAGNQATGSKVPGEKYYTDYVQFGQKLGQYVLDNLDKLTKAEGDGITLETMTYTGQSNKDKVDQIDAALAVKAIWDEVGRDSSAGKAAATNAGFSSIYEVSAIIERTKTAETEDMELKVMDVSGIGMIFAPYEMFSSQGKYIKENSPYDFTLIVTCGEGAEGYLPDEFGFEMGCYEACVSDYARGTAEDLAETFVEMLTEIKGADSTTE